mgnify:CR=1 FL=1
MANPAWARCSSSAIIGTTGAMPVPVPIVQEDLVELDETITFEVTAILNATIADQNTATLTITNDDSPPSLAIAGDSQLEAVATDGGSLVALLREDPPVVLVAVLPGKRLLPGPAPQVRKQSPGRGRCGSERTPVRGQ